MSEHDTHEMQYTDNPACPGQSVKKGADMSDQATRYAGNYLCNQCGYTTQGAFRADMCKSCGLSGALFCTGIVEIETEPSDNGDDKLNAALEQIADLQTNVADLTRIVEAMSYEESQSEAHVGREEAPNV